MADEKPEDQDLEQIGERPRGADQLLGEEPESEVVVVPTDPEDLPEPTGPPTPKGEGAAPEEPLVAERETPADSELQPTDEPLRPEPEVGNPPLAEGATPPEPPAPEPEVVEVVEEAAPVQATAVALNEVNVDIDVDLAADLFAAPPPFAAGAPAAAGAQAEAAAAASVDTSAADGPPVEPHEAPAPLPETLPETELEPLEVVASEDDDPGLLEQVADAVADLWDDTKDAIT
jgi:hypothetical protein